MWETFRKEEVLKKLKTNLRTGLSEEEVVFRRSKYGKNKLEEKKKETLIVKFLKQFNDFMIIILILASVVSAGISYLQGENDYFDSLIIIAIVILNAIMGVVQEAKAEKSIEALKQMTPPKAKVIRNNGKSKEINAEELVPGDIIVLEAGNYVPADSRLLESYNLKIEESSLTGETEAVLKDADIIAKKDVALGDMKNLAFMTSIVVNGHGKAVVTETGMDTKVGKIANMIIEDKEPETPIQKKLAQVGKILGLVCLAICILIFLIGMIKKVNPIEMFMTSVGLAVAAIPEGLPAIVTIVLSIGVTKMAKNNSIIRKLPAVETLGSSKVICSDKTGTLTKNQMTVVETKTNSNTADFLLELGSMCTDCDIIYDKKKLIVKGEPTETAIVEGALKYNKNKNDLYKIMPRINEIPFDSNRKMMTTIHKIDNGYRIITKGAPDVLLDRCNLSNEKKNKMLIENDSMAKRALRVIAIAYKDVNNFTYHTKADDFESTATQKENITRLDCSRFGKNDEETIIWFDKNTGEGLIVLPNQKKATRVRFSDVILNAPFEYTNIVMEIETDAKILYTWIYTDEFDGKECYVLCYNKNNKEWIDKETGLLLKKETDTIGTSEFTNIEVNTVDEVYKPDLTGYEIVNEEND